MEASSPVNKNTSPAPAPALTLGPVTSPVPLPKLESPPPAQPSNDNQITDTQPPPTNIENEPAPIRTISKEDDHSIKPRAKTNHNEEHKLNHQESSIKLKRCKHGRIIIKDLSKKKLAQHSDIDASNAIKPKNESNNNHIVNHPTNDNGSEGGTSADHRVGPDRIVPPTRNEQVDVESNHDSTSPNANHKKPEPRTPPMRPNDDGMTDELRDQISPPDGTDKQAKTRLTLRARARSKSSSGSLSPIRVGIKTKGQSRRSRRSRSPVRRDRNSSRDRVRSSHRTRESSSPRLRDRSSPPRRRNRNSSSRRHYRSPYRHRLSDSHHHGWGSPSSRSPNRKLPRSRSATPTRRSTNYRTSRREDSHSPSRDKSKYSHGTNYERSRDITHDKGSHRRSPDDRRLRTDTLDSVGMDNYLSVSQNNHDSQSTSKSVPVAAPPLSSRSSLAQVLSTHQPTPPKFSPRALNLDNSPRESPQGRSPATPSDGDTSSSDIYDPEGPIVPISPGDSPPMSPMTNTPCSKPSFRPTNKEKNGDDELPSSAVQLNQQEKYLQKLNRQERVIEEVKVALRPFYQNRSIDKEQYKDVLRRAVPKICHSKNGEINPIKIRALVDAYIKKMKRH